MDSAHPPDVEHNDQRTNVSPGIQDRQKPLPHTCLTRPVLLTVANYGSLVFLEICIWMFLPLVYTTPTQLGGLGLDPIRMGSCMAVWGILRGVLQLAVFHRILNFLGLRRTYIALLSGLVPSFLLFPINGTRVQYAGTDIVLWALVLTQLLCSIGVCMAYGTQRSLSLKRATSHLNAPFQAVPSYTSHLQLQLVGSARQTASLRRLHPYSVRSGQRSLRRYSLSLWRRISWVVTACSMHWSYVVSGASGLPHGSHPMDGRTWSRTS